jgi:hypothetical protein
MDLIGISWDFVMIRVVQLDGVSLEHFGLNGKLCKM